MSILKKYFNQTRKPEGFLGKMMVNSMNTGHAKLADWGFKHLLKENPDMVIDLGCGGGRNVSLLLQKYPNAKVTALDYSPLCVESAKNYNRDMVAVGRCTVLQGDVSNLQMTDESFDLATAFETVYFWPELENSFHQVAGILKKGGLFMICNESDGCDSVSKKFEGMIDGMKCYTGPELEEKLKKAGFSEISMDHHPSKPWITVIAKK